MEDLTGRVFGPYEIVASIGQGGTAVVYKAYQAGMDVMRLRRAHLFGRQLALLLHYWLFSVCPHRGRNNAVRSPSLKSRDSSRPVCQ